MVSVLIVDDQAPFRHAARAVVRRLDGFEVVGEADTGEEAVAAADRLAPELVLMDINLPGIDGVEATRRIVADHPDTVVVLVSTYEEADLPEGAATCGAVGYLQKAAVRPQPLGELWERHHHGTR